MESLVESKNCKKQYAEIIKCIDLKKAAAFEKRLSIFQECKEQFQDLGFCVTK